MGEASPVRVLPGPEFQTKEVERVLSKWIRRSGLLSRQPLESLRVSRTVWRPFRQVQWQCLGAESAEIHYQHSLVDEELASTVEESDERLLLWRPRYIGLKPTGEPRDESGPTADHGVSDVIHDLLQRRAKAQDHLAQAGPDLRRLQADALSPVGLVLPRNPFRSKHEKILVQQHQSAAGTLLATSLVTNCPPAWTIETAVLGERVGVGTLVGEYRNLRTQATRLLALEMPGAPSLKAALSAGRALTRLCELNPTCAKLLAASVGLSVRPN